MRKLALGLIRLYQLALSPYIFKSCRFIPSCSEYTYEAIAKYGLFKGVWLGVKRLARCQPLRTGGYDPVP